LLSSLVLCKPADADLLSLNVNSSGVLEAAVYDLQTRDARRFKKGDNLFCRWRLPDIDSIEWPLKGRGIVYKRAYRKCRKASADLAPYPPKFSGDGSNLVFNTKAQGVWVMDRRGRVKPIPGLSTGESSPDTIVRSLIPVKGTRELFVLQVYRYDSLISMFLDSWKSDIWWIPDLMLFKNSSLIMSRGNSRVEAVVAVSGKEFLAAEALAGIEGELEDLDFTEPEVVLQEGESETPEIDWPWLDMSRLVHERLTLLDSVKSDDEDKPSLYFLLNGNRFARLVPGEPDMTLYPELDSYLFSSDDFLAVFRLLDPETAILLRPNGLYRVDLMTGQHELVVEIPWRRIKYLYRDLALSPDHRYAAFRAWTTAQRQEIFLADLATGKVRVVVKGEMNLKFIPGRDNEAGLNPGIFNFTPDGMALVSLWRVLDGQEIRVYRLFNGDLAPVPPKVEPEENETDEESKEKTSLAPALKNRR